MMNLYQFLKKLSGSTTNTEKTDRALQLADEVIRDARLATDKLSMYQLHKDPFTAWMVDIYQSKQEDNFHRRLSASE